MFLKTKAGVWPRDPHIQHLEMCTSISHSLSLPAILSFCFQIKETKDIPNVGTADPMVSACGLRSRFRTMSVSLEEVGEFSRQSMASIASDILRFARE